MTTHETYRSRYEQDYVEQMTPREKALKREHEQHENKFKAAVKELFQRLRLK
jgi:hypothetical protein